MKELHQIVQESVDEKYEYSPRDFGKNTKLLVEFFVAGKSGKAVVFATPEGDFLSPKAVENKVRSSQISLLEAELEKLKEIEVSCVDDRLLGRTDEYLEGYNTSTERWREQRDNHITYLTEQIEEIKKLI